MASRGGVVADVDVCPPQDARVSTVAARATKMVVRRHVTKRVSHARSYRYELDGNKKVAE
jgi:hypothetical protein